MITTPKFSSTRRRQPVLKYARRSLLLWLVFLPLVIIIIIPILYMITMAFTVEADQFVLPIRWIPEPPTLQNFRKIFADPLLPLTRWFLNSLLVAGVGTIVVLICSSLSGYAFARLAFPGKNMLFSLLLFSLMIPTAITLIPSFILLRDLNLIDTYFAIWMPAAASVIGVFLLRQHFYAIPSDLEDAARVDGAGRFRIYWQVCLPLVSGSLFALAIFTFLALWNDLFWPLIVLSKQINLTLPI
ncbi:MAG: carbohydrate ABC transporter permease, partial [Caldilineaceae bacterium]|nr:carbohydrate ABC transporter permease [Caldilineaceae bacterium]